MRPVHLAAADLNGLLKGHGCRCGQGWLAGYFAGQLQCGTCFQPGEGGLEEGAAIYLIEKQQ